MNWQRWLMAGVAATVLGLGGFYAFAGWYGYSIILRRGMTTWSVISRDDSRISAPMRMALRAEAPLASAGAMTWQTVRTGLDVGELPVLAEGVEVDRILLTRIDPARFRFEVLNEPNGRLEIDDWVKRKGASAAINGNYYTRYGLPDTPIVSNGRVLGPADYDAQHGVFRADAGSAKLVDLAGGSWKDVFAGALNAMVNYPILIGADGKSRAQKSDSRWIANRSFVGEDTQGRIIFGTTKEAFFSLSRFADFLPLAPLGLRLALNLDGGPPACQAVETEGFKRSFCGKWETQTNGNRIYLLGHLVGEQRWALPIVLVAIARE